MSEKNNKISTLLSYLKSFFHSILYQVNSFPSEESNNCTKIMNNFQNYVPIPIQESFNQILDVGTSIDEIISNLKGYAPAQKVDYEMIQKIGFAKIDLCANRNGIICFVLSNFIAWAEQIGNFTTEDMTQRLLLSLSVLNGIDSGENSKFAFLSVFIIIILKDLPINDAIFSILFCFIEKVKSFDDITMKITAEIINYVSEKYPENKSVYSLIHYIGSEKEREINPIIVNKIFDIVTSKKLSKESFLCLLKIVLKTSLDFHLSAISILSRVFIDMIENIYAPIRFPPFCIMEQNLRDFSMDLSFNSFSNTEPVFYDVSIIKTQLNECCGNTVSSLLTKDLMIMIDSLFQLMKSLPEGRKCFIECALAHLWTKIQTNHIGILCASITYFLSKMDNDEFVLYSDLILQSPIFAPEFTFFNDLKSISTIGIIRNQNIHMILQKKSASSLIESVQRTIDIFGEVLLIMMCNPKTFFQIGLKDGFLVESLTDTIYIYQKAYHQNHKLTLNIGRTRSILFLFVEEMINNCNYDSIIIMNQNLIKSYFRFLQEDNIERYVFLSLSSYIKKCGVNGQTLFFILLSGYMADLSEKINDLSVLRLSIKLLQLLHDIKPFLHNSISSMDSLFINVFTIINNLEYSPNSIVLFEKCFSLLYLYEFRTEINSEFNQILINAFSRLYNKIDENSYDLLRRFFLKHPMVSPIERNYIKYPNRASLVFVILKNTNFFAQLLIDLSKMCSQSYDNSYQCHIALLDRQIISKLNSLKIQNRDDSLFDLLLTLFYDINKYISSPSIIKDFISLLCPISHEAYFVGYLNILKTLYGFVSNESFLKGYISKINDQIVINDISRFELFRNDFLIMFWVLPVYSISTINVCVCQIMQETAKCLKLYINNGNLSIHDNNGLQHIYQNTLYNGCWNNVILRATPEKNSLYVTVTINGFENTKLCIPKWISNTIQDMFLQVGEETKEQAIFCEFGRFIVKKFESHSDISGFIHAGPKANFSIQNCIFSKAILQTNSETPSVSFCYKMLKVWKLDLVIPIVYFLTIPNVSSHCILDIFFSVIQLCLFQDSGLEVFLFESHQCHAMFYLFCRLPYDFINLDFYYKCYSFFQLITLHELKCEFLESIILNPYLWLVSKSIDHCKILTHWNSIVFRDYLSECYQVLSFEKLLSISQIFYWFECSDYFSIEGYPGSSRPRDPELNIALCREEINNMLLIISNNLISESNSYSIVSRIQESGEIQNARSLLSFFKQAILCDSIEINIKKDSFLSRFLGLFLFNDSIIREIILVILFELYRNKKIDEDEFIGCNESIIQSLERFNFDEELSKKIIDLLKSGYTESIPLCFWFGSVGCIPQDYLLSVFDSVFALSHPFINCIWIIWPIVFLVKLNRKNIFKGIMIIDKLIKGKWKEYIPIFFCVSASIGYNFDLVMVHIITFLLSSQLSIENNEINMDIILNYLFIQNESSESFLPINEKYKENIIKQEKKYELKSLYVYKNIIENEIGFHFGLRVNNIGVWTDENLALKFVWLYRNYPNDKLKEIFKLVCYYIYRCNPNDFDEIIDLLDKNTIINGFGSKSTLSIFLEFNQICENYYKQIKEYFLNIQASFLENVMGVNNYLKVLYKSDLVQTQYNCLHNLKKEYSNYLHLSLKIWSLLWSGLSVESGPWESVSALTNDRKVLWKRDSTLCNLLYPSKLKRMKEGISISDKIENIDTRYLDSKENQANHSHILLQDECKLIKVQKTITIEIKLMQSVIEIIHQSSNKVVSLKFYEISQVLCRTRCHRYCAIEILTRFNGSYFIEFKKINPFNFLQKLSNLAGNCIPIIQTLPFNQFFKNSLISKKWISGETSNFEYLLLLNMYSGRSFNDLSQYPLMPWVIKDYSSSILDLSDYNYFRDLSKTVGELNEKRIANLIDLYNDSEGIKYMYSSGQVSSLSICLLLLRIEPFASIHKAFQGNKFDNPDRLLTSISKAFTIINNSNHDFWEIVPEFFFMPEVMLNTNDYDFGSQKGVRVHDLELPKWARTAEEFIYYHRKALESDYVSSNLNNWIDLVWGYKQKGEEARKSLNVYHYSLYENVWDSNIQFMEKEEIEAMMQFVGQIPPQLFFNKHPIRSIPSTNPKTERSSIDISLSSYLCVHVFDCDSEEISIIGFNSNGTYESIVYSYGRIDEINTYSIKSSVNSILGNEGLRVIPAFKNSFIIHNQSKIFILNVFDNNSMIIPFHKSIISSISASEYSFSVSSDDMITTMYLKYNIPKHEYSIRSFRDKIVCSAQSNRFGVLVLGSMDGFLSIITIDKGCTTRTINLNGEVPQKIWISHSWGFLIIWTKLSEFTKEENYLIVYSINGNLIRKIPIESPIAQLVTWSSYKGFDFMSFVTDNSKLWTAEVFYLNISNISTGISLPIHSMFYFKKLSKIVIFEKFGRMILFNYSPNDLNIL